MKSSPKLKLPGGVLSFTLIELMVVIAMIALLAGLVLPGLAAAKNKAKRIGCVGRLKQIGLSFRIFAIDHTNSFPAQLSTNHGGALEQVGPGRVYRQFLVMSNELSTPVILACPADTRKPATNWIGFSESNVSYFVGLDAREEYPQTLLAGDRNLLVNGKRPAAGVLVLNTNSSVGWDRDMHRDSGNIALGDGSVQQVTTARLREQVRWMGIATNRLLLP